MAPFTAQRTRTATALKQQRMLELLRQGIAVQDVIKEIGINRTTYSRWREKSPDFVTQVDAARGVAKGGKKQVPDFPTFCREYLDQPLYWHQLQWYDLLEGREPRGLHPAQTYERGDPNYVLMNTPPEHAKTTTISTNYTTHFVVRNPNAKVMLVSKTVDFSKEILFAVKQRLTHPRFAKLQMAFGPPGGWKQDSEIWAADQIYFGSQRDSGEKDPTIQSVGIGGQIYGARCDLVIVDDAVVLSNAHQFETQIRWLQQEVLTRLGPTGRLLVVGTRVDAIDLYRELRNPERYPSGSSPWTYLAQPAVLSYAEKPEDWGTLWPRADRPWGGSMDKRGPDGMFPRWDGKNLARRRAVINPRSWSMAYQQADVEEDSIFDPAKVKNCINGMRQCGPLVKGLPNARPQGMTGLYILGSMDPAMVGDTGALVYAVDRHAKKRYVLDVALRTGPTPAWIRDLIKSWTTAYGIHEWRIERNSFQQFLTQDQELNEWLASKGVRLSEHTTTRNKWDPAFGVASMAVLFNLGLIELPSTHKSEPTRQLVDQLITWYPETKAKTDLVMALWFAEIRAREICQAATHEDGAPRHFLPNRFLTKRRKNQQMVVNLNDLAVARWDD